MYEDLPLQRRWQGRAVVATIAFLALANAAAGFVVSTLGSTHALVVLASAALAVFGAVLAVKAFQM